MPLKIISKNIFDYFKIAKRFVNVFLFLRKRLSPIKTT